MRRASGNAGAFARAIEHLERDDASRRGADASRKATSQRCFDGGVDRIAKKIGEEATEVVIAAKNKARDEIVWEVADLIFHTLVLLAEARRHARRDRRRISATSRADKLSSLEGLAGVGPATARTLARNGPRDAARFARPHPARL